MRENGENNPTWQATADKSIKTMVLQESQGNVPVEDHQDQKGHRRSLHA